VRRRAVVIRLALLAVLIVFMPNALHFPFETGIPGINLSNLLVLLALAAVILSGRDQAWTTPTRGMLTPALIGLFVALGLGFVITQLTMPIDVMVDFTYLKNAIFYPLLYFIFRRSRADLKSTRRLIALVLVVAVVAGLEAVREGLDYGITTYKETHRASGPFGVDYRTANRAGVFYAMFLPMFVALALFLRSQRVWRLAAIGASLILAMAIMVTFSRQSYLIGILGLSALLLRRNILVALLSATVMFASMSLLPDSVTQRVEETEQSTASGTDELDTSTASRFEIWSGATLMWQEHPLGVGLNRFKNHIGYYSRYAGYDAHNFYVLTLAELGPIGLAALLWVLWRLWRLGARLRASAATSHNSEAKALALGFSVMVVAVAFGNVYGSPFLEGAVMADFWVLCGLLERYAQLTLAGRELRYVDTVVPVEATIGTRFPLAARALPNRYGTKAPRA
jgi:O-antigen ligase